MKESPAMMKKEVAFMKKKGAPKAMIKHEMAEAKAKPKAKGKMPPMLRQRRPRRMKRMMGGGSCK
jgi:hypothetical protein